MCSACPLGSGVASSPVLVRRRRSWYGRSVRLGLGHSIERPRRVRVPRTAHRRWRRREAPWSARRFARPTGLSPPCSAPSDRSGSLFEGVLRFLGSARSVVVRALKRRRPNGSDGRGRTAGSIGKRVRVVRRSACGNRVEACSRLRNPGSVLSVRPANAGPRPDESATPEKKCEQVAGFAARRRLYGSRRQDRPGSPIDWRTPAAFAPSK